MFAMGIHPNTRASACWPVVSNRARELLDHFVTKYSEGNPREAEHPAALDAQEDARHWP
jgi:hypothetical protein